MILGSVKGVFIVLFIIFMFLGWLFQTINKLKQGMEKNKRIRHKGKLKPSSSGPFQGESAEDFFARMAAESSPTEQKERVRRGPPKLSHERIAAAAGPAALAVDDFIPKRQERLSDEEYFRQLEEENDSAINDVKPAQSISRKRKSSKTKHYVNRKNLKSFKHGIIMNEVLNRPKAYEL